MRETAEKRPFGMSVFSLSRKLCAVFVSLSSSCCWGLVVERVLRTSCSVVDRIERNEREKERDKYRNQ